MMIKSAERERTLEQLRASDALDTVQTVRRTVSKDVANDYASYVAGLAPSIIRNGLGQSCAGLLARAKGETGDTHFMIFQHLQAWLCRDAREAPYRARENLMQALTKGDRYQYLHAQMEALAWLEWLKRFSTAYLKTDQTILP